MKTKNLHLICNAHIDPVWQWEWEEGAAETVSTFRTAAELCEEFKGFVFCHNEALLYKWIDEYEPELSDKIKNLVEKKSWHIMGGWHLQPDCNMPSGEALIRQILSGRKYFSEKYGISPSVTINFDSFGHSRGLVQIVTKTGYDSYMCCRPSDWWISLPSDAFIWKGYDGSEVTVRKLDAYNTPLGHAQDKIRACADKLLNDENKSVDCCLWGVGDHGGGPSRKDIADINKLIDEYREKGVNIIHSTPRAYFDELKSQNTKLPVYEGDLNNCMPGCLTSQARVKQKYRELENMYFAGEKMCVCAGLYCGLPYPSKEIEDALYDMLMVQFHDALPGSSIQGVEEMAVRMADHGIEIMSRLKAKAFFAMATSQSKAKEGELPIMVFNPHPYPVEGDFECEFMLADQNWSESFNMPVISENGNIIPSQPEKEASNIPIDWRKRVVFHAKLKPMSMNRFECTFRLLDKKPSAAAVDGNDKYITVDNKSMKVKISKESGLCESIVYKNKEYLKGGITLDVMKDNTDPWGMTQKAWREKIGEFTLLSAELGSVVSDLPNTIPSVRTVEDGDVRTVVESVLGYGTSAAIIRYKISKILPEIGLEIRIFNKEKSKMIKLSLPHNISNPKASAEVVYGEERLKEDGSEQPQQKYLKICGSDGEMAILNRGIYGYSYENNTAALTLLRSPCYTAHPLGDRKIVPDDRYTPHIDQGERIFHIQLKFGDCANAAKDALTFNETPMVLSFFPSGKAVQNKTEPPTLSGGNIIMSALYRPDGKNEIITRLFNPNNKPDSTSLEWANNTYRIDFTGFEIKTFRLLEDKIEECAVTDEI